jgi:hypothetical protein
LSTVRAASGGSGGFRLSTSRRETPLTASMTIAAPWDVSAYSKSRATCGFATLASMLTSSRNMAMCRGSVSSSDARYLIATISPVATRRATTTRPWAPLPQFVEFLEPC